MKDENDSAASSREPVAFKSVSIDAVSEADHLPMQKLFDLYATRLIALANQKLSPSMRQRLDGEDIVQSVYRSFYRRASDNQYTLESDGQIWRLLAAITLCKVQRYVEFHTAQKRSILREVRAEELTIEIASDGLTGTPDELDVVAAADVLEHTLAELDDLQKRIIRLRISGETVSDIARLTLRSERTVRRLLKSVAEKLKAEIEADTDGSGKA